MNVLVDYQLHFGDAHHHTEHQNAIVVRDLNLWYPDGNHALKDINVEISNQEVLLCHRDS